MTKKNISVILVFSILLIFFGCGKYKGFKKTSNGLYYKFIKKSQSSDKPKEGDIAYCQMKYMTMKDSVLFSSIKVGQPVAIPVVKAMYRGDVNEAFENLMHIGDSAVFILSADSFYTKNVEVNLRDLPSPLKHGDKIKICIRIDSVMTKAQIEKDQQMLSEKKKIKIDELRIAEKQDLADFLKREKIKVKPLESGIHFIELKKGNGALVKKGNKVKMNYTGFYVDGRCFDTSIESIADKYNIRNPKTLYKPLELTFGETQFIPGFTEAISLMSKGAKAKVVIPSVQGYGEEGYGPIPPCKTLVFEMEILDVE